MQESKKISIQRLGAGGVVDLDVLPSYTVGDVLAAIGAPGALGLSTASAGPGFVLLPGAVLMSQIQEGVRLYIVGSCCPGS